MFALAASVTVFNIMFISWMLCKLLSEDKAKIAGFAFVLGGIVFSGHARDVMIDERISLEADIIAGLFFVFCQFWRRKAING